MYVDAAGGFYPCGRFMDVALTNQLPRTIGNVKDGLDLNRLRPFIVEATGVAKTPAECMDCELATTCPSCVASDYDLAETPTIFQRGTQICLMHKAKVRANRRYWAKVDEMERKDRMAVNSRQKQREVV